MEVKKLNLKGTNCYVIKINCGWILIDAGWPDTLKQFFHLIKEENIQTSIT